MAFDEKQFSQCLKLLKNSDPQVFDYVLRLFYEHVEELTTAVTEAPADQILVCQGRAREARKLFRLFTELPEENPPVPTAPAR